MKFCWNCLKICCRPLPQRFVIATMVLSGLAIQYINRLAFNLVITEITFPINASTKSKSDTCEFNETLTAKERLIKPEFAWDSKDQGILVGAFFFGYIFTHLPGGMVADRYGPKKVLGYGVILTAICSILTPLMARTSVLALTVNRVLMGLAQGPVFPAISTFVARWSLPEERGFMSAYMSMGVTIGAILGNVLTGLILANIKPWDVVFYFYGGLTFLWYISWYLLSFDSAEEHPFITEDERNTITTALRDDLAIKPKLPICAILKSIPVWAMIIAGMGHDWAFYIIASLLPQYMSYVLHFSVKENGLLNALPYIAMFIISLGFAKVAEFVRSRGWMSKTLQCKLWLLLANMVPCICYLAASYAGCNRILAVVMFVIAMGIMGMVYSSIRVCNVDMSPNFAGFLMSLMNGMGSICGFTSPYIFGLFTKDQTISQWRNAFFFSTVLVGITTVIFLIGGTSKTQPWNNVTSTESSNTNHTGRLRRHQTR